MHELAGSATAKLAARFGGQQGNHIVLAGWLAEREANDSISQFCQPLVGEIKWPVKCKRASGQAGGEQASSN